MSMLSQQDCDNRIQKLNEIIEDLSTAQDILESKEKQRKIFDTLETIYTFSCGQECDFRHEYSQIFGKLIELKRRNSCDFNTLAQNMQLIYELSGPKPEPFRKSIHKLYDHINLEIARIAYIDSLESRINDDRGTLKNKINDLQEQEKILGQHAAENELSSKRIRDNINGMQRETITILGLFSAVILVFMSGIGFSSSVLQSMNSSSIYKVSFISLLLGFALINVICLLFRFIEYINCKDKKASKFGKFILIINFVIFGCMIADTVAWLINLHQVADYIQKLIWK